MIAPLLALVWLVQSEPTVDYASIGKWVNTLTPSADEFSYDDVPWRTSWARAKRESVSRGVPMFVWIEPGHPLGTTSTTGIQDRLSIRFDAERKAQMGAFVPLALSADDLRTTNNELEGLLRSSDSTRKLDSGIAAFAPSGTILAEFAPVSTFATTLQTALKTWSLLPASERRGGLPPNLVDRPYRAGSYLRVIARDLNDQYAPLPKSLWNIDCMVLSNAEIRSLVPADSFVGATSDAPDALMARLAQRQFVDFVRGLPLSFAPSEVQRSWLKSKIVLNENGVTRVALSGGIVSSATGNWALSPDPGAEPAAQTRGIDLTITGRLEYNATTKQVSRFDLVAVGKRWGGTPQNGRLGDLGPKPIAFVATLSKNTGLPTALDPRD